MNKKRTNFVFPTDHQIVITPYYLLGLIEAEGCFYLSKSTLISNLQLEMVYAQKNLILAIKQFLLEIALTDYPKKELSNADSGSGGEELVNEKLLKEELDNFVNIFEVDRRENRPNTQPTITLRISNFNYIYVVLIPFFDQLIFFSKKGLDYQDWKTAASLKKDNKHLLPEGKELITHILNRMNNNRLTTNPDSLNKLNLLEMKDIDDKIQKLLESPKSGIWVYENNNLIAGSPFKTYSTACKSVGSAKIPKQKYLDTNVLFKKKFSFFTTEQKHN